ncbi:MAG: histone deacetylase [Candidatus Aenigmarchaeota archaeon]|nr:histone deacetylase [Candidatus Aenigmarchaeota archaeon]
MKPLKIIFSRQCLEYDSPGHPESSERVRKVYEFLKMFKYFKFLEPKPCSRQDLLMVHSNTLVDTIKHGDFEDSETPNIPNIYYYARLSAGGAVLAMKTALNEGRAFSLMRPPGHHASQNKFEGFCYFNNIAIAVTKALTTVKKIAILDIDAHHGQGTQEIFMGDPHVIYVSLHQYGFIYPGTGRHSEKNAYNFPLPAGTDEKEYIEKLLVGIDKIREFDPDLIAVSAGFDTYEGDPLTSLNLKVKTYEKIGKIIAELDKPRFAVLEGGYSIEKIPLCVYEFLKGFNNS